MGIFSVNSPIDASVESATDENNMSDDWGQILTLCDEIKNNSEKVKEYYKAVIRRINHSDPHVVLQALNLLDACVCNCGENFMLEVASKHFECEYRKLLSRYVDNKHVYQRLKELLKKWATHEFENNRKLILIPMLYNKLKSEGIDFNFSSDSERKSITSLPKDPNIVVSQEEEEDVIKAIELSLKETSLGSKSVINSVSSSLYPTVGGTSNSVDSKKSKPESQKVRALYDFQAAEENELTFKAGEIIHVLDDSDQNWWKGSNQLGEGLFPSSFVTTDLSYDLNKEFEKKVLINNTNADNAAQKLILKDDTDTDDLMPLVDIDEGKIDQLLTMFHEADPTNIDTEPEDLINLEEHVYKMGPLIDNELEKVDCCNAELTKLSADLVSGLNMYHTLMKIPQQSYSSQTLPRPASMYNSRAMLMPPIINQRPQFMIPQQQMPRSYFNSISQTATLPHNLTQFPHGNPLNQVLHPNSSGGVHLTAPPLMQQHSQQLDATSNRLLQSLPLENHTKH